MVLLGKPLMCMKLMHSNQLSKFHSFSVCLSMYMILTVNIIDGHSLSTKVGLECLPKKTKMVLYLAVHFLIVGVVHKVPAIQ